MEISVLVNCMVASYSVRQVMFGQILMFYFGINLMANGHKLDKYFI